MWIRIRAGLRHSPRVAAMARLLCSDPRFIAWSCGVTHNENVTCRVTVAFVTRVTVAALVDLWGSLNVTLNDSCIVPFMTIEDIDSIVDIPGFGDALQAVGWVRLLDDGGAQFPNFLEHNTPEKMRTAPKSDAERARAYRVRKKEAAAKNAAVTARHENHGTSRPKEKNRDLRERETRAREDCTPEPSRPVMEPGNFDPWLQGFLRVWNKTSGVAPAGSSVSELQRQMILERRSDPWWETNWQAALAKFPLKFFQGQGALVGLSKFLEPNFVERVIGATYDTDWKGDGNGRTRGNSRTDSRVDGSADVAALAARTEDASVFLARIQAAP